jgi:hypothetical protein
MLANDRADVDEAYDFLVKIGAHIAGRPNRQRVGGAGRKIRNGGKLQRGGAAKKQRVLASMLHQRRKPQ